VAPGPIQRSPLLLTPVGFQGVNRTPNCNQKQVLASSQPSTFFGSLVGLLISRLRGRQGRVTASTAASTWLKLIGSPNLAVRQLFSVRSKRERAENGKG